jgi:hypothetical protein
MVIHDLKHPIEMILNDLEDVEVKSHENVKQNEK